MIHFENLLLYTMLLNLEQTLHKYAVIFPHVISITWKDGSSCSSEELSSYPFSECNGRSRENKSLFWKWLVQHGTFILLLGFVRDFLCTMVTHLFQTSYQQFR